MTSVALTSRPALRSAGRFVVSWKFWLPTLLVLLAVIIPDFEVINVLQATGIAEESDLLATMATENSLREYLFLLNLLALGSVGALLFLFGGDSHAKRGSFQLWMMMALVALGISSLAWSTDVDLTFRRLVITVLFIAGCWGMGKTWCPMDLVHMVLLLSAIFALTGIAAEIVYGTFLSPFNYRFSGFLHPNRQALSCGLFVLAALTMKTRTGNWFYWLVAGLAYFMLVLTGSRGGVLACAVAAIFYFLMATPPSWRIAWFSLAGIFLGGTLLFVSLDPTSGDWLETIAKLGRSDPQADPKSLTGRLPIWNQIVADILERPTLGYGYAAYWSAERVLRMSYIHDWEFSNAHSSYLEMLLALGMVGFMLCLLTVAAVFGRGMRLYARTQDLGLLFILSVFVMAMVSGLVESIFVSVGYEYIAWMTGAFLIVYYPTRPAGAGRLAGELI